MEIFLALCGLGKEALLALEQEKKAPAEIHYKKVKVLTPTSKCQSWGRVDRYMQDFVNWYADA